jgi:type III secretory pathway component EscT
MFDGMLYKMLEWCNKTEDKIKLKCVLYREGIIGFVLGFVATILIQLIF